MTPPPALSPPALHFLVLDFTITCGTMEFTFSCTTDTAVHLTLHLSPNPPIVRRIPYVKRGADFTMSSVTCFVVTDTYDQNEAGDTFAHTFTVPITGYGIPYYWYLTGTHSGAPSLSMSQIFTVTCSEPTPPTLLCHTIGGENDYAGAYNCYEMAGAFQPLSSFIASSVDVRFGRHGSTVQCYDGQLSFYTAGVDGKPGALLYGPYFFTHPPLAPNEWLTQNVTLPNLQFYSGFRYSIAIKWADATPPTGYKYMRWCRPSSATCPLSPLPDSHFWVRIFDRIPGQPCGPQVTAWYEYYINVYHYHQFYGHLS